MLFEAVDDDNFDFVPGSLDALLGEEHPRVRRFLAATRGLDPEAWEKMHAVLEKAKKKMVERKNSSGGGGGRDLSSNSGGGGGTSKL